MAETFMRQWAMLRHIPRSPRKIDTGSLKSRLEDEGYKVNVRTIQRDLMALSNLFPLVCDERNKPYGWTWSGTGVFDVPGMDPQTALAFDMSAQTMRRLLPASTVNYLEPYISRAHHVLDQLSSHSEIRKWANKVNVLPRGLTLLQPEILQDVIDVVYESLLTDRQFQASYTKRGGQPKEYQVNPLGLVLRDNITYLIASANNYTDPLQFVLHRFSTAELLDAQRIIPDGFDLDSYIADGKLGQSVNDEPVQIKLRFNKYDAQHLLETPLSEKQTWTNEGDSSVIIEAEVLNNLELRWWLQGFGSKVEVLQPAELRNEFIELAIKMSETYVSAT